MCQVHTSCWIPSVWIIISNYFFHYWYILWQYIPFIVDDNLSLVIWLDLDIFLITILFCIILSYPDVSILLAQSHCVFSWFSTLEYIICLFHWTHCKIIIFVSTIVYFRVLFQPIIREYSYQWFKCPIECYIIVEYQFNHFICLSGQSYFRIFRSCACGACCTSVFW